MGLRALFAKPTAWPTPDVACARCRGRRTEESAQATPLPHGFRWRVGRCLDCGAAWRNVYAGQRSG